MHVCCLVWEIPMIEGEHYTPILYAMYAGKAKKFLNALNAFFENAHMDWKCVLDSSACTYNEIFSGKYQAVIFVPEARTRQWAYTKEMQSANVPKYYLDFAEYTEMKLNTLIDFFNKSEKASSVHGESA